MMYESMYATPFQDALLVGLLKSRPASSLAELPAELYHTGPAMLALPIGHLWLNLREVPSNLRDKGVLKFVGSHGNYRIEIYSAFEGSRIQGPE